VIEAHHLSKAYRPGVFALRDLSFTVEKGEFVFLTGPSGAGKSTLFRLLLRADVPTSGDVIVNGRNLARLSNPQIQAYRRTVGFVFQDFKLIPRKTVFDNVALVPRLMGATETQLKRRVTQALNEVGLTERLKA
jgi:cell division transport system ATP-binding protein